jgi:tripartite motif-containing protein 71
MWGKTGTRTGQFYNPQGVAVDSSGNAYVSDYGNHRIQKFNSNGKFITMWGKTGTRTGQFYNPQGVAVDSSGNAYVSDYGNHRIQKFNSNGKFITMWGKTGTRTGQFYNPQGVAVDSSGNTYVSDYGNHRIQKFNSNGNFSTMWGKTGNGTGHTETGNVNREDIKNLYVFDLLRSLSSADSYRELLYESLSTFFDKYPRKIDRRQKPFVRVLIILRLYQRGA